MNLVKAAIANLLCLSVTTSLAAAEECPRIPNLTNASPYQVEAETMQYYTAYRAYCSAHILGECSCRGVTDFVVFSIDFCTTASEKCPYMGTDTTYCARQLYQNGCPGASKVGWKITSKSVSIEKLIRAATKLVNLIYTIQARNAALVDSMHATVDPIIGRLSNRPMTASEQRRFDLKVSQVINATDSRFATGIAAVNDFYALLGINDGTFIRADFDRDGKKDYLLVDSSTGNIDIWIRGSNRYVRSQTIWLDAKRVTVSDLNGDSKLDLTIERRSGGTISIPGNGAGLFLICAVPGMCWQNNS